MDDLRPAAPRLFRVDGSTLRLAAVRCRACDLCAFPAALTCPYCGSPNVGEVELSGSGVVEVATTVLHPPPGYEGPVPFGFGVVELPEGLRVITRIAAPEGCVPGASGEFAAERWPLAAGGETVTFTFRVDPSSPGAARAVVERPPRSMGLSHLPPNQAKPFARPVYIAGVGLHAFGRFAGVTLVELGQVAAREALREADLERGGFQAAYCASVYGGVAAGHKVLGTLGLTGVPILNIEAGCASGGAALGLAANAIASGQYDRVLVLGMEKMPRGIIRSSFFEAWREAAGLAVTPAYFALRAKRLMRDAGVTREQLAQVSVKNHRNGVRNPFAMYRSACTIDDVLGSPLVCDPLHLLMLCSPNEGAAAIVLSAVPPSGERSVRVLAAALRSHLPGSVLSEHTPLSGWSFDEPISATAMAASDAFRQAGIGPEDLDVLELQDTDSARELISYEELGLCAPGESGVLLRERHTEMTGRWPVNPSGGLLSKGEPLGASGIAQVVELYWQLRGRAGGRQLAKPRLGLAHTVGRGANASVVLVGH